MNTDGASCIGGSATALLNETTGLRRPKWLAAGFRLYRFYQHAEWGVSPWNRQEALRVAIAGMGLKAAQRKVSTVTHVTFGANTLG